MLQEISALIIFVAAVLYAIFQLGGHLIPTKKNYVGGCGSGSCGCKP